MIDCPACAGPDNAECDTCHGDSEVTQEVYDNFMTQKQRMEATWRLQFALSEFPVEVLPAEQAPNIVIAMNEDTISATVDDVELQWNDQTNTWS